MRKAVIVILSTTLLVGCERTGDADADQVATLYRNGSLLPDARFHFASFDVEGEANDYNINNCRMTERLLNANIRAQWGGTGEPDVGFWCEPGAFRDDGRVPQSFDSEYPTDVEGMPAS